MGGGDGNGTSVEGGGAERQYREAKTSVWWDIENCQVPKICDVHAIAQNVRSSLEKMNYCGQISISAYGDTNRIPNPTQQALSSTGITLNHVPAGAKDASDKKILVDMLFWAVDNPAPANYLLISGDRDFANALHQLRMRRYNILLAQPQKASAPLIAAAKSVWLWTSLLAGGLPLTSSELSQFGNNNISSTTTDTTSIPVSVPMLQNQTTNTVYDNPSSGSQKPFSPAKPGENKNRGKQEPGENKNRGKQVRKNSNQPNVLRTSSAPMGSQESRSNGSSQQSSYVVAAPHELVGANKPMSNGSFPDFRPPNPEATSWNDGSFTDFRPPNPETTSWNNESFPDFRVPNPEATSWNDGSFPDFRPPNPETTSWNNGNSLPSNFQHPYTQPSRPNHIPTRPDCFPSNLYPPSSHPQNHQQVPYRPGGPTFPPGPLSKNFTNLSIFDHPNGVQSANYQQQNGGDPRTSTNFQQQNGGDPRLKSFMENPNPPNSVSQQNVHTGPNKQPFYHSTQKGRHPHGSQFPPPSAAGVSPAWGPSNFANTSSEIQGLIGVILIALDTLKNDKMSPTESNLKDCIRYGEHRNRNVDVKRALDTAIEHQMVVKSSLGKSFTVYLRKGTVIWSCVNPLERRHCSKAVWDAVYNSLNSPGGRSAMMASKSRYEAATLLKNSCLKDLVLGDILQILNMVITVKKWIAVQANDWQPISITVGPETVSGIKSDT